MTAITRDELSTGGAYPIGMQTMTYPQGCFCNKTLVFCGNAVRSTLKRPGTADAPVGIEIKVHPHVETVADGEVSSI